MMVPLRFTTTIGIGVMLTMGMAGCSSPAEPDATPDEAAPSQAARDESTRTNVVDRTPRRVAEGSEAPPEGRQAGRAAEQTVEPLELLAEFDAGGYDAVHRLAVAPDGKSLAVGGQSLALWQLGQAEPSADLQQVIDDLEFTAAQAVSTLAFFPDGLQLAIGCGDGTLRVYSIADGTTNFQLDTESEELTGVALGPNGQRIATTGDEGAVRVWDAATGDLSTTLAADDPSLAAVAFSPDGMLLAACGQVATVWNLADGSIRHTFEGDEFAGRMVDVAFSPDGAVLAVAHLAPQIKLWSPQSGRLIATLSGAEGPIRTIAFSSDGTRLAAAVDDYTIRVWRIDPPEMLQTIDLSSDEATITAYDLAWTPAGALLAVTDEGGLLAWGPPSMKATFRQPQIAEESGDYVAEVVDADLTDAASAPDTVAAPSGPADVPRRPAHLVEATDVIDLTRIPWPEGTDGATDNPTMIFYNGPGSPEAAQQFYVDYFAANGWEDITDQTNVGDATIYEKDGFLVSVNVPGNAAQESDIEIRIFSYGNYDARWLPRPPDTEEVVAGFMNVMYTSEQSIEELDGFFRERFAAAGWHLIRRDDVLGDISLAFVQNGIVARVSVKTARAGPYAGKVLVQCSVRMLPDELPIPARAEITSWENVSAAALELTTELSIAAAVEFYDESMTEQRWEASESRQVGEDFAELLYRRGGRVAEINLQRTDDGRTLVHAESNYVPSKAVLQAQERANQRSRARRQQEDRDALEALQHAIPVAEFALPADAKEVFRNPNGSASGGDIRFQTGAELATNMKFFRDKLTASGWTEDRAETHEQQSYSQLVFRKEKAWIRVSLNGLTTDGQGYYGMVEGTGLVAEIDPRHREDASGNDGGSAAAAADAAEQQLEALGESLINQATQGGNLDPEQVEQVMKELESRLKEAE